MRSRVKLSRHVTTTARLSREEYVAISSPSKNGTWYSSHHSARASAFTLLDPVWICRWQFLCRCNRLSIISFPDGSLCFLHWIDVLHRQDISNFELGLFGSFDFLSPRYSSRVWWLFHPNICLDPGRLERLYLWLWRVVEFRFYSSILDIIGSFYRFYFGFWLKKSSLCLQWFGSICFWPI